MLGSNYLMNFQRGVQLFFKKPIAKVKLTITAPYCGAKLFHLKLLSDYKRKGTEETDQANKKMTNKSFPHKCTMFHTVNTGFHKILS